MLLLVNFLPGVYDVSPGSFFKTVKMAKIDFDYSDVKAAFYAGLAEEQTDDDVIARQKWECYEEGMDDVANDVESEDYLKWVIFLAYIIFLIAVLVEIIG